MRTTIVGEMYRTPRRYVSDREDDRGTVQFMHALSIEGEAARFYEPEDLTVEWNGDRDALDKGVAMPVEAEVDVVVYKGALRVFDLLALRPIKAK